MGSACQAGKPSWRMPAAVSTLRHELLRWDAEDVGEALDLLDGEASLSAIAVAFGCADRGGGGPAHQLAEFCLSPSVAHAECPEVRADNGGYLVRDLIDATTPSAHHVPPCQVTL
jgi:hypothetical protein